MKKQKARKRTTTLAIAVALGFSACALNVKGQEIRSENVPLVANVSIPQGFSLISIPHLILSPRLKRDGIELANYKVRSLFDREFYEIPDGFEIIKLSGDLWRTNRYSAESGEWSVSEMTLTPGEGALVSSPSGFYWHIVGRLLWDVPENFIPEGKSLRASPFASSGAVSTDLRFPAVEGLTLSTVDVDGNFSVLASYENGSWQPEEPVLTIGAAFLIHSPSNALWNQDSLFGWVRESLQITSQPKGITLDEMVDRWTRWLFEVEVETDDEEEELWYQWQHNGNDIEGANQSSYTIPKITAADAGSYSVIVFSSSGAAIRSDYAFIEVMADKPTLATRLSRDGETLEVTITGVPGQTVRIEASQEIPAENWEVREENLVVGENGTAVYTESILAGQSLFVRAVPL